MNRRCFFLAILVWVSVVLFPASARACAVCVTGAANDPVTDAFNWSVIFLMATPYSVVGSVAGWLIFTHWRAARKRSESSKNLLVDDLAWIQKESGR